MRGSVGWECFSVIFYHVLMVDLFFLILSSVLYFKVCKHRGCLSTCWTGWVHFAIAAVHPQPHCRTTGPGCRTPARASDLSCSEGTKVCSSPQLPANRGQHTQSVFMTEHYMRQPGNSQDVEEKAPTKLWNTTFDIHCLLLHLLHIKVTFLSETDLTIKTMTFTQTPLSSRKMKQEAGVLLAALWVSMPCMLTMTMLTYIVKGTVQPNINKTYFSSSLTPFLGASKQPTCINSTTVGKKVFLIWR